MDGPPDHLARGKRLDLALAHAELNAAALARSIGISPQSLAQMKSGRHLAPERWRQAAAILKISGDWLLYGTGPAPTWAAAPTGSSVAGPVSHADQVAVLRADLAAMAEQMRAAFASFAAQLAALQAATGRPLSAPPSPYPYADNPLLKRTQPDGDDAGESERLELPEGSLR